MKINFTKLNGLVPAVIQDYDTLQIRMVGFMDKEAYQKTLETKKVWFYSRTKKRLWMKGEESGNILELIKIIPDCDYDSLLVTVKPKGPTCHTGDISCFKNAKLDELESLCKTIQERKSTMPKDSYTTSLFKEGLNKICVKVAEESGEVIKAATKESKSRLIEETADLFYHMIVLLAERDISFQDIKEELNKRRR